MSFRFAMGNPTFILPQMGGAWKGGRGWLASVLSAAILTVGADSASAAEVSVSEVFNGVKLTWSAVLTVQADPSEANSLTITSTAEGDRRVFTVREESATLMTGEGCRGGGPAGSAATCEPAVLPQTVVRLGDGGSSLDASAVTTSVRAIGGSGPDVISIGPGGGSIRGGGGADRLKGGARGDLLRGEAGSDRLLGMAGGDLLSGGAGFDRCRGGPGRDRVSRCENGRFRRHRALSSANPLGSTRRRSRGARRRR